MGLGTLPAPDTRIPRTRLDPRRPGGTQVQSFGILVARCFESVKRYFVYWLLNASSLTHLDGIFIKHMFDVHSQGYGARGVSCYADRLGCARAGGDTRLPRRIF